MNVEKRSCESWVLSSEFKTLKNQFKFLNKETLEYMVDKDKYNFLIQEGRNGVGYYEAKVRKLEPIIRIFPLKEKSLDMRMEMFLENLLRDGLLRELKKDEPTTKS